MGEQKVRVDVLYPAGHHYVDDWERLEIFCPECGKRAIWRECNEGDYYVGPSYLCSECGGGGQILFGPEASTAGLVHQQRLNQIRAALEIPT